MATWQLGTTHDGGGIDGARYEVKAVAPSHRLPQLRAWLHAHPMAFATVHPPRQVNNVYFDTPFLDSYADNLSGHAERQKARLRWYGEDYRQVRGRVEFKHKRGRQGWKVFHDLAQPLDLLTMRWAQIIAVIRGELVDSLRIALDECGWPVLINRFQREYYASLAGDVRATLDYNQMAYDQRQAALPNLRFPVLLPDWVIVEFKAGNGSLPALARALDTFPLRISRNSKYATAVEAMLGRL